MPIDQLKIDSNITGLRYSEETALAVSGPTWVTLEPNSYNDFGGQLTTVAREPINPSRQQKKGVVTDLDASGGFNMDLTQKNMQDILQGFFFADMRFHNRLSPTAITGTDTFDVPSGGAVYITGDIIWAENFTDPTNNGKFVVVSSTATTVVVAETLVNETPGATATIERVGHRFLAAEVDIDDAGVWPALDITGGWDPTVLGLVPGSWLYIGGDVTDTFFVTAANNGFKRIKTITAAQITFDKSDATMVTEAAGALIIEIFFGRILKNETGTLIKRRTYTLERLMGAPDSAEPTEIQAEYLNGATPNEFSLSIPSAEKIMADLSFVATDNQQIASTGVLLSNGDTIIPIEEADAFNTSSDFTRIKLALVVSGDEAPTALFAFATELTLRVNNNITPNKAVSVLGAFDVTAGNFEVSGDMTVYFVDVAAVAAVRNNSDITLDWAIAKANAGIVVDIPLIALGDGRSNVEKDQAIQLPLSVLAATGAKVDPNMDHTLLMNFFPYLPIAAE